MLEALAYAGWWFRELVHIVLWLVCVGYPEFRRELDIRLTRNVGCKEREELYD